eukprot:g6000.t1
MVEKFDVSGWDVSGATDMTRMFAVSKLESQDFSSWDVSKAANLSAMFLNCKSFFTGSGLAAWNVKTVKDFSSMFRGCSRFCEDLSSWEVSSATSVSEMFRQCHTFDPASLAQWDVGAVTSFECMFFFLPILPGRGPGGVGELVVAARANVLYGRPGRDDYSTLKMTQHAMHRGTVQCTASLSPTAQ